MSMLFITLREEHDERIVFFSPDLGFEDEMKDEVMVRQGECFPGSGRILKGVCAAREMIASSLMHVFRPGMNGTVVVF